MKIKDKNKKIRERKRLQEERGITLVALIITIIVLVILAVVSVAAVYNSKIVEYAINGAQDYTTQAVQENQIMRGTEGIIQSGINRINEIVNQGEEGLDPGVEPEGTENNVPTKPEVAFVSSTVDTITFKAKSEDSDGDQITYTISLGTDSSNLNLSQSFAGNNAGEEVTLTTTNEVCGLTANTSYYWKIVASDGKGTSEETEVQGPNNTKPTLQDTVTKSNLGQYLGKVVDYTPSNPGTEYGTSTIYKLFYIDYDNKYKDGAGTIYLKAECDGKTMQLSTKLNDNGTIGDDKSYYEDDYYETTDDMEVMKKLNPEWAKTADAQALKTNGYASWWIADPTQWEGKKDNTKSSYINYVVGSPSLEMYVDSYNAYLTAHPNVYPNGTTSGTNYAKKLECKYVSPGYKIGLVGKTPDTFSGLNSIIASSTESMYNPGSSNNFRLASPSSANATYVSIVYGKDSNVNHNAIYVNRDGLCPLVSLKSNVPLSFK